MTEATKETPEAIFLADYQPPDYRLEQTHLIFEIGEGETRVENRMSVKRTTGPRPLMLDGENLVLESVAVDGRALGSNEYALDDARLTIHELPETCEVTVVTRIQPEKNTALEGLYKSSGMYCTQCEAEGFRRITYYPDRPDVLSVFTTSIVAAADYPVLLANGNKVSDEALDHGRRKVTWHDPFPKPSYLFALVAGDLSVIEDSFVTRSGREVALQIYTEPHNIDQCDYAMDALKRSMRWDEEAYGREYDLDIYMIVAVDDFNMGAMENKGLNIFNTSCVLATPDTATDQAYQRVEAVIAHEYFHNWSGNRVTCRDWFQLSLKEGFTVYRDAQFSGDMNSSTVKRIEDVNLLRAVQFAEDAGPLAHPVRPASYIEISNFYTPTVYEKGAEVVGMVRTLIGPEAFRAGSDLYFERHDGQAVTTEDFLAAMADSSGADLEQFQRWYDQAGTPVLEVSARFKGSSLLLRFEQRCPATPGQTRKQPFHIPVAFGLLSRTGDSLVTDSLEWRSEQEIERRGSSLLLHLRDASAEVELRGLDGEPEVSMLRGFSAPVKVEFERPAASLAFLATRDPDGFAAWDALQSLLIREVEAIASGAAVSAEVIDLFGELLVSQTATAEERFLLAAKLAVPSENYLFEAVARIDVDGICGARDQLLDTLAGRHRRGWEKLFADHQSDQAYSPDADAMAQRALKNGALGYLARVLAEDELEVLLSRAFEAADNLTDRRAVLQAAVNGLPESKLTADLLARFYERWQSEALVVNQWFAVQAAGVACDLDRLQSLVAHPAFELTNPNKVRSVLTVFAGANQRNFHAIDGSGYAYIADRILALNEINPQMAASLAKPLTRWRRYAGERSNLMRAALMGIAGKDGLSTDVFEVVTKSLS
jgi:aminopeptidase N